MALLMAGLAVWAFSHTVDAGHGWRGLQIGMDCRYRLHWMEEQPHSSQGIAFSVAQTNHPSN